MANFSWQVDPDTNQLSKKKPLVRPNPDDVYRQDADQPYDFGVPNAQQPVGGNPGTYDLNGSAKAGFMANSAIDPEFVKRSVAGLLSANTYDQQQIAPPGQPPATGSTQGADVAPDQSLLSGIANGVPQQQNIPAIAGAQGQINTLEQQKAAELANFHPSKLRQFMGGLAGVGAGIMSRNPIAGYGAYKGVVDSPKGDIVSSYAENEAPLLQQIASGKDLAAIQSTYMQRLGEVAKYGPNSPENITANARAKAADTGAARLGMEQNETRNIEIGDPTVSGGKTPAVVNKFGTGQARPVGPTITPKPEKPYEVGKPTNYELNDGRTVAGTYDPNTKKVTSTSGEDITSQIRSSGENLDTNLRGYLDLWKQDFVSKNNRQPTPKEQTDEIDKYRTDPSRATIILRDQMANATTANADPEQVKYWADKVSQDAKNYGLVPKNLKNAVGAQLAKSGANINNIDAQTRDASKFSKTALTHVAKIEQLIDNLDKRGQLGVAMSRWNDLMSGKIGSDQSIKDKDLKNTFIALADNIGLLSTAMGRVHGGARGGSSPYMIEHLKGMVNAGTMDPNTLRSGLGVFKDWLQGYAEMGGETAPSANFGNEPAQGASGTANTPPAAFTLPNGTTVHRQADGTYK